MATKEKNRNDEQEQKGNNRSRQQEGRSENSGRSNQESQQQSDSGNSNRGFAAMDDDQQRKIASKGGKAVSRDREHMAEIGRKGGQH